MEAGQAVDGDLLGGRSAYDWEDLGRGHAVGQGVLELLHARGLALEVALHQIVVGNHDALHQRVVDRVLLTGHFVGDGPCSRGTRLIGDGGVGQEIRHPAECRLLTDGQLERGDAGSETCPAAAAGSVRTKPSPGRAC